MKSIFLLLIPIIVFSCNDSDQNTEIIKDSDGYKLIQDDKTANEKLKKLPKGDYFSFNLQYSHHSNSQRIEKGKAVLETIQNEFNLFPWEQELSKVLDGKGQTSPTFSIVDHLKNRTYAVSIIGFDGFDYEYWMFYVTENATVMKKGKTKDDVYGAIEPFFKRDMIEFEKILNKPEKIFNYSE